MDKIIVVSHRRSGTHLTIDTILNNFLIYGSYFNIDNFNNPKFKNDNLQNSFLKASLFKTHSSIAFRENFDTNSSIIELFENAKIIYVVRNCKDVMVSLYFYLKSFDNKYANMGFNDFLQTSNHFKDDPNFDTFNRIGYWGYHVTQWVKKKNILVIKYEDLLFNYEEQLYKIKEYTGIDFKDKKVKDVRINDRYQFYWKKLYSFINKNISVTSRFFRRGKVGDYDELFNEKSQELISANINANNKIIKDLYPELVIDDYNK